MTGPRLLTAVLLAGLGCLVAVAVAERPSSEPSTVVSALAPDRAGPLAVLRGWDRARAGAGRRGSPQDLRDLYVQGSAAGRSDQALLRAYAERGLRVAGLLVQRAAVEVVAEAADRIELRVTDRVVGAAAIGRRGQVELPRDGWSTRTVVLVRLAGDWRVAEVRDQARPVASTDVTSRSANS